MDHPLELQNHKSLNKQFVHFIPVLNFSGLETLSLCAGGMTCGWMKHLRHICHTPGWKLLTGTWYVFVYFSIMILTNSTKGYSFLFLFVDNYNGNNLIQLKLCHLQLPLMILFICVFRKIYLFSEKSSPPFKWIPWTLLILSACMKMIFKLPLRS